MKNMKIVSVQKTVIELITKLQREKNIAMGFICHDLGLAQSFAHEIAVMYLGNIVETMPGEDIGENSLHPYTKVLTEAYTYEDALARRAE